jgi:hypothetical protein
VAGRGVSGTFLAICGSPEMAGADTSTDESRAALEGGKESLVGSWISPSCGTREYPRSIQFKDDSTFAAEDLVSPCPPDVTCFWGGIVYTRGTYAVEEGTIFLKGESTPLVWEPFPDELLIDPTTGSPVEQAPGGDLCHYEPVEG